MRIASVRCLAHETRREIGSEIFVDLPIVVANSRLWLLLLLRSRFSAARLRRR